MVPFSDFETMNEAIEIPGDDPSAPIWDCRWPDTMALQVATERILNGLPADEPRFNRRLPITVRLDPSPHTHDPTRALLIAPWGVERIYWTPADRGPPPILHVAELETDAEGRVAAGIGVLLETEERQVPVVTAWEPETGHYFLETLLHSVWDFDDVETALATALGRKPPPPPKTSLSGHLNRTLSRRSLLGFGRR